MIPIHEMADMFSCCNRRSQFAVPEPCTYAAKVVQEWADIVRQTSKAEASKDEAEVALERGITAGKGKDNEEDKDE
eukprot:6765583-Pyramimonas_sp.AAC.1